WTDRTFTRGRIVDGSRRVHCRPHRGDYPCRGSPPSAGSPPLAQLSPPTVSPLRSRRLPQRLGHPYLARPQHLADRPPARPVGPLLQAPLPFLSPLFRGRSVLPGPARQSLHPPGHHGRRPFGRGGRVALPHRFLAALARPPRLCPLRHDPELGRGGGKKRQT